MIRMKLCIRCANCIKKDRLARPVYGNAGRTVCAMCGSKIWCMDYDVDIKKCRLAQVTAGDD